MLKTCLWRPDGENFIARSGDIHRVQAEVFDVDVWVFDRMLGMTAAGESIRGSLEATVYPYRGDPAEDVWRGSKWDRVQSHG